MTVQYWRSPDAYHSPGISVRRWLPFVRGVLKKGEYNEAKANAVVVEPVKLSCPLRLTSRPRVSEVVKEAKELVDLTGAEVVVSVGRGISKDVETVPLAEERPACSAALLAALVLLSTLVGCLLTTRLVRPKTRSIQLYVALGISGAIQHKAGMQDSEYR